ncbi:MAG: trigger factor [Candidatus Omnitrophota bacterium]
MKIEVKALDGSKKELSIEVSGDTVKNKFEDVFKKITQEAKIPGFRPGNAPREMVEKRFADHAHDQVLKELVPDIYNQALNQENIDALDVPEISDVKLDRVNLSFKAKVEVRPEIAVKDYKDIKVSFKSISVTTDEVKRNIDTLKEQKKADNVDEKFARELGYPNTAELEKAIERQISIQKDNQQRAKVENDLLAGAMKGLDFKTPKVLLDRQLQDMLRQTKIDLAMKGVQREQIDQHEAKLIEQLKPDAEKQVRIYLVLSEIAKKENIPADDHMPRKVMELLFREANWVTE